jgi:proteasome accessory factor B
MSSARHERLMNLLFVLINAKRPLPREEIKLRVPGYSESQIAFERMFERDKEDLREVGFDVRAVPIDELFEDNLGYIIEVSPRQEFQITLSLREIAYLRLATEAWRNEDLRSLANFGAIKLEASDHVDRNIDAYSEEVTRLSVGPGFLNAKSAPILHAIMNQAVVSFDYQKPGETEPSLREVEPWALVCHGGNWYMKGYDLSENAPRTFRLSRMLCLPVSTGAKATHVKPQDAADGSLLFDSIEGASLARVWIADDAPGEVQRIFRAQIKDEQPQTFRGSLGVAGLVEYWDAKSFAATLLPFLPFLVVLEPSELRIEIQALSRSALERLGV